MGLKKIAQYYHTVKHLKARQVAYNIYYRLRNRFFPAAPDFSKQATESKTLELSIFPDTKPSYRPGPTFEFLNKEKTFTDDIDWNYPELGKLWTYQLNYFDYLHQPGMDRETGLQLIRDFIDRQREIRDGMEPYAVSLRGVNWIKFLSLNNISEPGIDRSLYGQYCLLYRNPEYHLMGNHLLENGMSLLFGAFYFNESRFLKKAKSILFEQLDEQTLGDGGHFERSPMYHLILLNRMLDCFNLLQHNDFTANLAKLREFLALKIELMLGWLMHIRFSNGDLPAMNDSTNTLPIVPQNVIDYGYRLGFTYPGNKVTRRTGESGYRMIRAGDYELFLDAGKPGPDYIPGHAHCDIFSFILYVDGKPVIVDPGVSTYEEGVHRKFERSTAAHNTVTVGGMEQSDVWKAFRVGRRARVTVEREDEKNLIASHDGFWNNGVRHQRAFSWDKPAITIKDCLQGKRQCEGTAHFHFHPSGNIKVEQNSVTVDGWVHLEFKNHLELLARTYEYAHDFNKRERANCIKVRFREQLQTEVIVNADGGTDH